MTVASGLVGAAWLREVTSTVAALPDGCDAAERIDRIRQLEVLKSAIAAAQLREAVAFDTARRAEQAVAGVPVRRQGRGVAAELALARAQSPWQATRWLGWGRVLTSELPVTFGELRAGRTSEWRALLMARETVWLSREDRAAVDAALGPRLHGLGDRQVENAARAHAQRLDPAGAVERRRVAEAERRVTLRPRPDTMSSLSITHSVERGVEMYALLSRDADTLVGTGQADGRSREQVMSDVAYQRITGRDTATGPGVEVELLVSTDTLLGTDNPDMDLSLDVDRSSDTVGEDVDGANQAEGDAARQPVTVTDLPAHDRATEIDGESVCPERDATTGRAGTGCTARKSTVDDPVLAAGIGVADRRGVAPIPIPAPLARSLIAGSPDTWLRRVFTCPDTGDLVAMESRRRRFDDSLKRFVRYRDQHCSTPYCGAPIRHIDHARDADHGGATSAANGNGKCAACNYAKQAPGWRQTPTGAGRAVLTTPSGHHYPITPPRPPGWTGGPHPAIDLLWNALTRAA